MTSYSCYTGNVAKYSYHMISHSICLWHQVRATYKRALLSFHPDRASGSDVRQQVEDEEKFKLVLRMKDKIP
ncbi:DnaJ domain-containing protein [Cynara cardunculus var. scolymus]|uniref:DnaJ domain-containing protein n=1 Tax=Cynara cardunculus var. scolymus TaxID=59895 RepID=A0A103XV58_CYNCS|nr:DnaJ domain-containing protein [Cynara cardunculus var. scolymus]